MKNIMEKYTIIKLKLQGYSNRKVSKITEINRKTIAKYWREYITQVKELEKNDTLNISNIQESIVSVPKYDSSTRKARKYTEEIDQELDEILDLELNKNNILGNHKQKLTKLQIHKMLLKKGYNISYSSIANKINEKKNKSKECFIKQLYEFGDRLEYDFGEVKLVINKEVGNYHMAVLSSPAANFRWAFLYKNQKKDVFMDSHVKFFEMIGGVYQEVVYDNMKNVVTKFIGKNEKELNEDLIKMSIYYGFNINVTNCFSGNEKGHVEGSVKIIRNHVFAVNYEFGKFEDAEEYLNSQLIKMNEGSKIEEEKLNLLPYKPKLELAKISINKVNKYSFIRVENNFYSVPEYLVDKEVTVKSYFNKIVIYSNNTYVCEHKKTDGIDQVITDINHYLKSMRMKPGAIKNSFALKSIPELKSIYDKYFNNNSKKFIEILIENKGKNPNELVNIFKKYTTVCSLKTVSDIVVPIANIYQTTKNQISLYDNLCIKEGGGYCEC